MQARGLTKSDDFKEQMAIESQWNPCYQYTLMIIMFIIIILWLFFKISINLSLIKYMCTAFISFMELCLDSVVSSPEC